MKHLIIPKSGADEPWGTFDSFGKGLLPGASKFAHLPVACELSHYDILTVTPKTRDDARRQWSDLGQQIDDRWIVWAHFPIEKPAADYTRPEMDHLWTNHAAFTHWQTARPKAVFAYSKGAETEDYWSWGIMDLARAVDHDSLLSSAERVKALDECARIAQDYFEGFLKIWCLLDGLLAPYLDLLSGSDNLRSSLGKGQALLSRHKAGIERLYDVGASPLIDERMLPNKKQKLDPAVKLIEQARVDGDLDAGTKQNLVCAFKVLFSLLNAQPHEMGRAADS